MPARISGPPSPRKGMGFRIGEHGGRLIPAMSFTQPWCECIFGGKDIENRTRATQYVGPLWMHAAKTMPRAAYNAAEELAWAHGLSLPPMDALVRSAFVGLTWVVGCSRNGADCGSWAFPGQYGWKLDQKRTWRLTEPLTADGALGLWRATESETRALLERLPAAAHQALAEWRAAL